MKIKKSLFIAPAMLAAATLVGCGGNGGNTPSLKEGEVTRETFYTSIYGCYELNKDFKVEVTNHEYYEGQSKSEKYEYKRYNDKETNVSVGEDDSENQRYLSVDGSYYSCPVADKETGIPEFVEADKTDKPLYYESIIDQITHGDAPALIFDTFKFENGKYSKTIIDGKWKSEISYTFSNNKISKIDMVDYKKNKETGNYDLYYVTNMVYTYDCVKNELFTTPTIKANFDDIEIEEIGVRTQEDTERKYKVSYSLDDEEVKNPSYDEVKIVFDSDEKPLIDVTWDKNEKVITFKSHDGKTSLPTLHNGYVYVYTLGNCENIYIG